VTRQLKNDLLLRAARRERTPRTPVWMMRQAGRFDPAYRAVRDRVDQPLETMFRTPDIAVEISLLPRRFGVDAIIFYQDILTPLTPMGAEFVFRPGPELVEPIRDAADLRRLRSIDPAATLPFVGDTLRTLRRDLGDELPLLGFAGAPLTLLCFILQGGSPGHDLSAVRAAWQADPAAVRATLDLLAAMTADYLAYQVSSGVDAVQLFESLADALTPDEYEQWAHPYHVPSLAAVQGRVPTILYAKEQPRIELMLETGADVLSVGTCVDLAAARAAYGDRVAFQGNVDNRVVATGTLAEIDAAVAACVTAGGHTGHILNLNHGVLKETPFENGCRVIEKCKQMVSDVDAQTSVS
jgi:uroporphyrinogen decarboxylase